MFVCLQRECSQPEGNCYSYRILRSEMCDYLVSFIHKLKQLPETSMMNSVLENFSILQVNRLVPSFVVH